MSQSKQNAGKKFSSGNSGKNEVPPEGFADFMDLASDMEDAAPAASPEVAEPALKAESAPDPEIPAAGAEPALKPWRKKQENGTPAWAWGMLPAICTLIIGAGLGSALIFLFKGSLAPLLDFSGWTSLSTLYDLNAYPQHIFYAVLLFSVLLQTMVGYRMGAVIRNLKQRANSQQELLSQLMSLRLDNEEAWTNPIFKVSPEVESFTVETLGAWRHKESRVKRVIGLEGELHRLEKALSGDSRTDLAGKFEIPVVGMVADEILQLHDERDAAVEEVQTWKARLGSRGHEVMGDLRDARGWQRFTLDQLNLQEDAVSKASEHLVSAGSQLEQDPRYEWDPQEILSLLVDIHTHFIAAVASDTQAGNGAGGASSAELLDRMAKLNLQIGMEVARLGARGERMAPMAQTLEELTRAFREQAGQGGNSGAGHVGVPLKVLERLETELAKLEKAASRPQRNLPQMVQKLGRVAQVAAGNLAKIAGSFDTQYERLDRACKVCADLTGLELETADSVPEQENNLELSQFDPFLKRGPEEDVPVIDPFMERQSSVTVQGNTLESMEVSNNILPGDEDVFTHSGDQVVEPCLPDPTPQVYDLSEFDAVKMPDSAPQSPAAESVYDLSEFGAVLIPDPQGEAHGADRVYDLGDFGARRLD